MLRMKDAESGVGDYGFKIKEKDWNLLEKQANKKKMV